MPPQVPPPGGRRPDRPDTLRWFAVRLGVLAVVLLVGWTFIAWVNRFHITPPLVFVMIAFLAIVLTIYNLWRTGAAAVANNDEDDGDASWGRPVGATDELEREKRTLLKAIKEAEFDLEMGKLSQADAHAMIQNYRAHAIEVIKQIDRMTVGEAGTVRERIEREVRARLEIESKTKAAADKTKKKPDKKADKAEDKVQAKTEPPVDEPDAAPAEKAEKAEKHENGTNGTAKVAASEPTAKIEVEAKPEAEPKPEPEPAAEKAVAVAETMKPTEGPAVAAADQNKEAAQ